MDGTRGLGTPRRNPHAGASARAPAPGCDSVHLSSDRVAIHHRFPRRISTLGTARRRRKASSLCSDAARSSVSPPPQILSSDRRRTVACRSLFPAIKSAWPVLVCGPGPALFTSNLQGKTHNQAPSVILLLVPDSISTKLANLVLPQAGGADVRLGSLWEQTPAVIVFLRHYG